MKSVFYHLILVGILLQSCQQNKPSNIKFEKTFQEIAQEAKKNKQDFCIVLSNPRCTPCDLFLKNVSEDASMLQKKKIRFNIVDVSLPQNKWYQQLVASMGVPTSLLFSQNGELKAVIQGAEKRSLECIGNVFEKEDHCSHYLYKSALSQMTDYETMIKSLQLILKAKQKIENGEDASSELDQSMQILYYPYVIWLQIENARKQNNQKSALLYAKQLLTFQEPLHAILYSSFMLEARHIVNPHFRIDNPPCLKTDKQNLDLGVCRINQAKLFSVKLSNIGKDTLTVRDIRVSCTCVKLKSSRFHKIAGGKTVDLNFSFTADVEGDIMRDIIIITDGIHPMETVQINAYAKK